MCSFFQQLHLGKLQYNITAQIPTLIQSRYRSVTTRILMLPFYSYTPFLTLPHQPLLIPLESTDMFPLAIILSFQECCVNELVQSFQDWLSFTCMVLWRFIQIVGCVNSLFLFVADCCFIVYRCITVGLTVLPVKDICVVSSVQLLQINSCMG